MSRSTALFWAMVPLPAPLVNLSARLGCAGRSTLLVVMALITWLTSAHAQEASSEAFTPRPLAGHAVLDLRVGVDRLGQKHPVLCAEGSPTAWLSIEGCGTGAGVLHKADEPDMAHFRARLRAASWSAGRASTDVILGAGFAEVQSTADEPGFKFGKSREAEPVEAAGPEASASLKARYWADRGGRTYLTCDLNFGAAVIPAAPEVLGKGGAVVPFAMFSAGVGF